jgi:hypothetical protein
MKPTKDYKLIPMFEITDEAREIAVAWMECEDKHWIRQKHKLASDIMNYAEEYHKEKLRDDLKAFNNFVLKLEAEGKIPLIDSCIEDFIKTIE